MTAVPAKKKHKNVAVKVWAIVSALVLIVVGVVNYLALNKDAPYYLGSFFDVFFGGQRPIYDDSIASMFRPPVIRSGFLALDYTLPNTKVNHTFRQYLILIKS